ncbi:hypothetical protein CHS0354_008743 [Potamilus streckersoni]|uniref:Mab-21-like nucleotidyltransferase domain-containing protein n=1 Tax=Potamilus streckersoni TaxID=2493646 RepID=A0AAE0T634_9BIVA|nr:hypothetical protein CHS0354_008743 [Potamilus streckersoni]
MEYVLVAAGFASGVFLLRKLVTQNVRINLNEWQYPVKQFSWADGRLESKLKELTSIGELDISQRVWDESTALVNQILELLMKEMRSQAKALRYEGIVFDGYRKQGSAREGLKIRTADEFDVLLEYHIEGLYVEPVHIVDYGIPRPGLGKIKILNTDYQIETQFTKWVRKDVIVKNQGSYFLNARILHQSVFESIMDRCREKITNTTKENISFQLTRSMNPPSVNLTIKIIQREKGTLRAFWDWLWTNQKPPHIIDIDVVPALIINMEKAMCHWWFMTCPRYAVVKWMEESQPSASYFMDPSMTWRLCTSGYEKHYMDLARTDTVKRYIMTACRIIKLLMCKEKEKQPPLPISTFLRSFYLKNIAFYCMLFTKSVKGVYQALGYFLGFLKISLEEERLPQFFQGNYLLGHEFPACAEGGQINLFQNISPDTLDNARRSLGTLLNQLSEMYDRSVFQSDACYKFRNFVTSMR